jgi:hypothetical protein
MSHRPAASKFTAREYEDGVSISGRPVRRIGDGTPDRKEQEMQYVMLIADDASLRGETSPEEEAAVYEKIGAWFGELGAKGKIVGGNELQGVETAKTIRLGRDKATVTDGPFIESKEVIGGYCVLECDSIDEAVEIAKSWPGVGSVLEVRPAVFHGDA